MAERRQAGLLFDMDGVICHNMPAHTEAWRQFFRARGIELRVHEFLHNTMGRPTHEVLSYFLKRPVAVEEADAMTVEKEELYYRLYQPRRRTMAGLRRFLKDARGSGCRIGVGTGSKGRSVSFILDELKLRDSFDAVVTGSDVKNGKPHPETFLSLAERLGVRPRQCVVFEDSLLGEKAAKTAGMAVVALTTSHAAHEFRHASLAIRDFRTLSLPQVLGIL